jgi:uncharacterized membrane protein
MTDKRPDRKPVQMSLFERQTVSVSWIAKRWNRARDIVIVLLESGQLKGYRMTEKGWWNVLLDSVIEYEKKLMDQCTKGDQNE